MLHGQLVYYIKDQRYELKPLETLNYYFGNTKKNIFEYGKIKSRYKPGFKLQVENF